MNTKILYIFISLSLFCLGVPVHAKDDFSPQINIEHAIIKARQYADKSKIDLDGKYINKVEYHNNMQNKNAQPYWLVLWINKLVTKGGGVELRLYEDGSVKDRYLK